MESRGERVLLVGVCTSTRERWRAIDSLEELAALSETARAVVVEKILQIRERFEPATILGYGKILEIGDICHRHRIDLLIFDLELSASQIRNIERLTDVRTIDRTTLILDIFAQHAHTREAKLQVELAQLEYRLPRLVGKGLELSRLGGGIGTRGPGEKKLEVDRRRIRRRISTLKKALKKIEVDRTEQRKERKMMFNISIVGYTNAGKSSLLNALTKSKVKVDDMLFSTLDPHTSVLYFSHQRKVLLTDTVGFIKHLPHSLIASFHATLEEVRQADLILHVIDISQEGWEERIEAVKSVLTEIKADSTFQLMVFNKCDRIFETNVIDRIKKQYPDAFFVSAKYGDGLKELKEHLYSIAFSRPAKTLFIRKNQWGRLKEIYQHYEVLEIQEQGDRILIKVR
ncbi:MAG: GTPase HflX [candidate division WOR-3 bacterium]